ncbi:MAG: hypothetical protein LBL46_03950 [Rickettsiales bacterium]|nr:hypothetical protein [Rickettsiales bacterium]
MSCEARSAKQDEKQMPAFATNLTIRVSMIKCSHMMYESHFHCSFLRRA